MRTLVSEVIEKPLLFSKMGFDSAQPPQKCSLSGVEGQLIIIDHHN
jgi:hypothetical protein